MGTVVSVAASLSASIATALASCCAASVCSCLTTLTRSSSTATRLAYALLFAIAAALGLLLRSTWLYTRLNDWLASLLPSALASSVTLPECPACFGALAVHRVTASLAVMHLLLAISMIGLSSASSSNASPVSPARLALQNGVWGAKLFFFLALAVASFFCVPSSAVAFYASYVAPVLAAFFLLILILIVVDFAHSLAERLIEHHEDNASNHGPLSSMLMLVCATFAPLLAALGIDIALFLWPDKDQAAASPSAFKTAPEAFTAANVVLTFVTAVSAISPCVQERSPRSGLIQAALVALFCTSLLASAVGISNTHAGVSIALSCLFLLVAILHLVFSDSQQVLYLSNSSSAHDIVDAAAAAGSSDAGDSKINYNASLLHTLFMLAAVYLGVMLTDWDSAGTNVSGAAVELIKSPAAGWIQVSMSWLTYTLYLWTLMGPVLFPDRDWS